VPAPVRQPSTVHHPPSSKFEAHASLHLDGLALLLGARPVRCRCVGAGSGAWCFGGFGDRGARWSLLFHFLFLTLALALTSAPALHLVTHARTILLPSPSASFLSSLAAPQCCCAHLHSPDFTVVQFPSSLSRTFGRASSPLIHFRFTCTRFLFRDRSTTLPRRLDVARPVTRIIPHFTSSRSLVEYIDRVFRCRAVTLLLDVLQSKSPHRGSSTRILQATTIE